MAETKEKWAGGTLEAFVAFCGTQRTAAAKIGIEGSTLNKLLNGHTQPSRGTLREFKRLRIQA